MNSLEEIEAAIMRLSDMERQLADRLQTYLDDVWDKQIAADALIWSSGQINPNCTSRYCRKPQQTA